MRNRSAKLLLIDGIQLILLIAFSFVLGFKTLADPDLGWHLAGGLWMLDHRSVPRIDFLGSEHSIWLAYSWLMEACIAACFRAAGFLGLVWAQFALSFLSAVSVYVSLSRLSGSTDNATALSRRVVCCAATLILVQLITPFWSLRPQLLSVIFFITALTWAEEGKLNLLRALLLTVVWANIHVFWVALPVVFFAYRFLAPGRRALRGSLRAALHLLLLLCCGAASPYGAGNVSALWQYALQHHEGYALIREFQPLRPDLGYVFGVFVGTAALPLFFRQRLRSLHPAALLLWTGTMAAAILQRKYLTLFSGASCIVYAQSVIPALAARMRVDADGAMSTRSQILLGAALGVFLTVAVSWIETPQPLPPETDAAAQLVHELSAEAHGANFQQNVLTSFDDGGWVGLALYLDRPAGAAESLLKTLIDGRTLVMGPERLAQYAKLEAGAAESCAIIRDWRAQFMILNENFSLLRGDLFPCMSEWETMKRAGSSLLLRRKNLR